MNNITIKQFIDRLRTFTGDERAEYIPRVLDRLSQVSYNQLMSFQDGWNDSKSFDEFRAAQDKEIVACIELECSDLGKEVRSLYGLDPITYETEV